MDNVSVKNCRKCGPLTIEQTWKNGRHLRCKKCRTEQNKAKYEKFKERDKDRRQAYRDANREKLREAQKAYREKNKEKLKLQYAAGYKGRPYTKRFGDILRKRNLTYQKYLELQLLQNNCCAICKKAESRKHPQKEEILRLSIDHCHETNIVRGLLCSNCNSAIGMLNHDILLHEKTITYLQKHSEAA